MAKKIQVDEDDFKNLVKSVTRIETALLGDKNMNVVGIADKVSAHSRYINNDRKFKYLATGAIGGANIGFFAWVKSHFM
jgi:hypothetical protein